MNKLKRHEAGMILCEAFKRHTENKDKPFGEVLYELLPDEIVCMIHNTTNDFHHYTDEVEVMETFFRECVGIVYE